MLKIASQKSVLNLFYSCFVECLNGVSFYFKASWAYFQEVKDSYP